MTEGRTSSGYVSLGKARAADMGVWLTVGWLFYHPKYHAAMFKADWAAIIPLCRRHESEPELRAFCKPYDNLQDLPFLDRGEVQWVKSSKNKKVYARLYTRQCPEGRTSYNLVIDTAMVLRLLDKPFSHIHFPDREKEGQTEAHNDG